MSCERSREIDVEEFLLRPADEDFREFREHYPECADCAAEVADWTAFEAELRAVFAADEGLALTPDAPNAHPTIERLERFLGSPSLAPEVAAHLEACPTCRLEANAMRGHRALDLAAASAPVAVPVAERGESRSWLARLLPTPAWGLAAAAAVAALLLLVVQEDGDAPPEAPRLAEQTPPSELADPESPATPPAPEVAPEATQLAQAPDPPLSESLDPADSDPPPPVEIVARPDAPEPGLIPEAPPEPPVQGEPREVILLAALDAMPPPSYRRPGSAGSDDWLAMMGGSRAADQAAIAVAAPPDHAGRTLEAGPRLWWSFDEAAPADVQILITTEEAIDPIYEEIRSGPQVPGPHFLDLAAAGVELEVGTEYRWAVVLAVNPDRPSQNPFGAGTLVRLAPGAPEAARVADAEPAERGHALAREGVFYDAYDFFATLAEGEGDAASAARARDALLSWGAGASAPSN